MVLNYHSNDDDDDNNNNNRPFLPVTSPLGPTMFPTAQDSSFRLQYFPYYV
jgi:hypothetical protein